MSYIVQLAAEQTAPSTPTQQSPFPNQHAEVVACSPPENRKEESRQEKEGNQEAEEKTTTFFLAACSFLSPACCMRHAVYLLIQNMVELSSFRWKHVPQSVCLSHPLQQTGLPPLDFSPSPHVPSPSKHLTSPNKRASRCSRSGMAAGAAAPPAVRCCCRQKIC